MGGLPANITSMFTNMATNAFQGSHFQNGPERDDKPDAPNQPGIRIGGNIDVDKAPDALRSVMGCSLAKHLKGIHKIRSMEDLQQAEVSVFD